jgi:TolA-binding protein
MIPHGHQPTSSAANSKRRIIIFTLLLSVVFFGAMPAFAVSKDMVQLQTQIQELQDAVARLQQSNDERMGVMKDLVQQSADSINKMSVSVDTLQRQMQTQQDAQNGKIDQISGQIQSLNDSLDEIKARFARLEKLMQDVQSQQQSMSANAPQAGGASAPMPTAPAPDNALPESPAGQSSAPIERKGKPSAGTPLNGAAAPEASTAPPADELYKTALGDYMSAKYALASAEFGDVIKFYPDNPLSGNSFYYQAEIEYRGGHYSTAIKAYDSVLDHYPDSNKVPVSHLHKGMALLAQKQTDPGVRELRTLIQRFPNSPEAMQARSKLSGLGIPVTPKH